MHRITPREVRTRLVLSDRQQAVLVGTLLGDGCLAKHGYYHRLHIKHKAAHRSLVEFKYEVFREFVSMPIHRFDQQLLGQGFPCMQFATRTSPVFSDWAALFYEKRRKSVPQDVACWLSPLAVAIWFMDDGAADHSGITFQTHSFNERDIQLLIGALRENFGIVSNSRQNRGKEIIYVASANLERLRSIVEPELLPEFAYKLVPRRLRTP